jgi:hypothetical protein
MTPAQLAFMMASNRATSGGGDPFGGHATLTTSLERYFALDGDGTDETGNSDLTTGSGTPSYSSGAKGGGQAANYAASWYQVCDYKIPAGDWSISAWFYLNTGSASQFFFGNDDNGKKCGASLDASNDLRQSAWYNDASLGQTVSTGSWFHFVQRHDDSGNTVYAHYNGTVKDTFTGVYQSATSTKDIHLGQRNANTPLPGDVRICHFAIWSKLLTTGEIADLYNSGDGLFY